MACQNCNCSSTTSNCTDCNKQLLTGCNECGKRTHEVVDTYAEVQEFRNVYVTVRDENAVYHVDETGNPVAVSRSFVFKTNYTPVVGDYKQNIVFDMLNNVFYVYDPAGNYKTGNLS